MGMTESDKKELAKEVVSMMTQALVPSIKKQSETRGYPGAIVKYTDRNGEEWPAIIVRTRSSGRTQLTVFQASSGVGNANCTYSETDEEDTWCFYADPTEDKTEELKKEVNK